MVPHNHTIRMKAIELHRQGVKKAQISQQLQVSNHSITTWIKRQEAEGEKGLCLRYQRCGRKVKQEQEKIKQRAIALKAEEQDWGASFILLHLSDEFPDTVLPKARSLQRWFKAANLRPQKSRLPKAKAHWVKAAFERVQVDAKEQLKTGDGQVCCYLNFTDEYTGSELDAFVFPLCPYQ